MPNHTSLRSGTQSVERAFAVLRAVGARGTPGARLGDVMEAVRLNRTTVYRLLRCLVQQGAVRTNDDGDRYFIGQLVAELGAEARPDQKLKELFGPVLTRIAELTGDTTFLQVRAGSESFCVDRRLGAYPVKTFLVEVGTRRPIGVGAGGIAILAATPPDEVDRVLRSNATRFRELNTTLAAVRARVNAARRFGYVFTPVHGVPGVRAVALPIIDTEGRAVAAIAVAGIAPRMTRTRKSKVLKILKAEIERVQVET